MSLWFRFFVISALLVTACTRSSADAARWQKMDHADRVLYVKALLGAEEARAAKGGEKRHYSRAAEDYVRSIDSAYASGDRRRVDEIFASLADR